MVSRCLQTVLSSCTHALQQIEIWRPQVFHPLCDILEIIKKYSELRCCSSFPFKSWLKGSRGDYLGLFSALVFPPSPGISTITSTGLLATPLFQLKVTALAFSLGKQTGCAFFLHLLVPCAAS